MDTVTRYGYVNAKLRARIGVMQESSFFEKMLKAPSLFEAVSVLKGTRYSKGADSYEKTGDLQQVELALFQDEIETHNDIKKILDSKLYPFMSVLVQKLEIENIKSALRLWYSASVRQHPISYRSGYLYQRTIVYPVDYSLIINAQSYSDVVKAFEQTPYSVLFKDWSFERFSKDGLFYFEMALDQLWYESLYREINKLNKTDKEVSLSIYNVDVDLKNLLMVIRYGLFHSMPSSVINKTLLPYGTLYSKFKLALTKEGDPVELVKPIVKKYYPSVGKMVDELLEKKSEVNQVELAGETLKIENYLAQSRKTAFTKILSGDPFSIGILLSYFFMYKQEVAMIKAILSAKYYKMDESEIREELL